MKQEYINYSYKAETHNFPGIAPFPGAATGGRMRDNVCWCRRESDSRYSWLLCWRYRPRI